MRPVSLLELSPDALGRVAPLARRSALQGHLTPAYAVIEGRQRGSVRVDDADDPRTAILLSPTGFHYALGVASEPALSPLAGELAARPQAEQPAIYATTSDWDALLGRFFSRRIVRLSFRFAPSPGRRPDGSGRLPPDVTLERLTAVRAAQIVAESGPETGLDSWFVHVAGGPEAAAAVGPGFCLVSAGRVVGVTAPVVIGNGEFEFEVGVAAPFRGRGLAKVVAGACTEACLALGLQPAYTCAEDNRPSIALARSLGFVDPEPIAGYLLSPSLVRAEG
jgi:RimJ/RimL family protein N-acetyltransferase